MFFRPLRLLLLVLAVAGCSDALPPPPAASESEVRYTAQQLEALLTQALEPAAAADAALLPVALLRFGEQRALKRYSNQQQLARARSLGVTGVASEAARQAHLDAGRLVRLADSTRYWVVRDLEHSFPLVTADVVGLLTRLGQRFQAALAEIGVPPLRLEVTSALRTSDTQAALRATNQNAARGLSTHEFGTTVDVAYSSFAAPAASAGSAPSAPESLQPVAQRFAALALERIAAQRSRELQAILGRVLIEMQAEGLVMVTLEELQPVYHMTVARRLADSAE